MAAIILLGYGHITPVSAQSSYYSASASRLNDAYVTLAHAKPIYGGHRVRAMHHVKAAATLHGVTIDRRRKVYETEGDSDAKLRAAQHILQNSSHGLSGEALEHVQRAIEEISAGLSLSSGGDVSPGRRGARLDFIPGPRYLPARSGW